MPRFEYPREIYKDYTAPIVRRADDQLRTEAATFGMVPRKHIPQGVKVFDTMNARSESIGQKRSFRGAWTKLQLCLIPCEHFYEPDYETGKAVRWRIGLESGEPLAIAGLWRAWKEPDGSEALSFTMLTVNADDHPLMKRFHRPGSEKRSLVIVPAAEYETWLACRNTDEAHSFLRLYPAGAMHAEPYPLPPRRAKAGVKGINAATTPVPDAQASLLADG
ncbi:SOS response-associated peptidase [Caballeronia sordidicola]|uniref:SOS response-associated peptidase n=1 Tax=Caballeronia sordidicola TaxID=196367 RepID=UPI002115F6F2|nr:SOS response-associated peptidase family protein [Caballeronia sordidicola]